MNHRSNKKTNSRPNLWLSWHQNQCQIPQHCLPMPLTLALGSSRVNLDFQNHWLIGYLQHSNHHHSLWSDSIPTRITCRQFLLLTWPSINCSFSTHHQHFFTFQFTIGSNSIVTLMFSTQCISGCYLHDHGSLGTLLQWLLSAWSWFSGYIATCNVN